MTEMKKRVIASLICLVLFLGLVYAVQNIDVAAIGPAGTSIGLSRINQTVHDALGVDMMWYDITEWIGLGTIGIALLFVLAGLIQLIRRRSLLLVDGEIYVLGCLYVVLAGLYVLFEIFIVNYRPVILPGSDVPEASFPSSHTMLSFVILGSLFLLLRKYVKNTALRVLLRLLCAAAILVTVGGRLLSGVHWVTDIAGGVLLSLALLFLFGGILYKMRHAYRPAHCRTDRS